MKKRKNRLHLQKVQTLSSIFEVVAAIFPIVAIFIYYFNAKSGVKLNEFYFFSFFIEISVISWLLFSKKQNKWVGVFWLLNEIVFSMITTAYVIDWIGSGNPKLNLVYESIFVGSVFSLIIIVKWIISLFMRK